MIPPRQRQEGHHRVADRHWAHPQTELDAAEPVADPGPLEGADRLGLRPGGQRPPGLSASGRA